MNCILPFPDVLNVVKKINECVAFCPHLWRVTATAEVEVVAYIAFERPCPITMRKSEITCEKPDSTSLRIVVVARRLARAFQLHDDVTVRVQLRSLDGHLLRFNVDGRIESSVPVPEIRIPPFVIVGDSDSNGGPVSRGVEVVVSNQRQLEPARIEIAIEAFLANRKRPIVQHKEIKQAFVDPIRLDAALLDSAESGHGDVRTDEELFDWITNNDNVDLSGGRIVGDYYRFEQEARVTLDTLLERICSYLSEPPSARRNFLVWGPSGIGKSFFFSELERVKLTSLGALYIAINASADSQEEVVTKLESFRSVDKPVLCLLDEVDSPKHKGWFCAQVFTRLEDNEKGALKPRVYVAAGSNKGGLSVMKSDLKSKEFIKGDDLVNRITEEVSVPGLSGREKAKIFAQACLAAQNPKRSHISIDALALYYVGEYASGFETIRSISVLAEKAMKRSELRSAISWTSLFEGQKSVEFCLERKEVFQKLRNRSVRFENHTH